MGSKPGRRLFKWTNSPLGQVGKAFICLTSDTYPASPVKQIADRCMVLFEQKFPELLQFAKSKGTPITHHMVEDRCDKMRRYSKEHYDNDHKLAKAKIFVQTYCENYQDSLPNKAPKITEEQINTFFENLEGTMSKEESNVLPLQPIVNGDNSDLLGLMRRGVEALETIALHIMDKPAAKVESNAIKPNSLNVDEKCIPFLKELFAECKVKHQRVISSHEIATYIGKAIPEFKNMRIGHVLARNCLALNISKMSPKFWEVL